MHVMLKERKSVVEKKDNRPSPSLSKSPGVFTNLFITRPVWLLVGFMVDARWKMVAGGKRC